MSKKLEEEVDLKTEKAVKKIKEVGGTTEVIGYIKIIASIILPTIINNQYLSKVLDYSYSDASINIIIGIILIILGNRIRKDINKDTKTYIWIIIILSGILGFINIVLIGNKNIIMFLLFVFSIYTLSQLKYVNISKKIPKYKIRGKKRIFVIFTFILIILTGLILDVNIDNVIDNKEDATLTVSDKKFDDYNSTGNMYNNNKYGFKIRFPEDWKQKSGHNQQVLIAASKDGNSINIAIKELPKYTKLAYDNVNINDIFTLEQFKDIVYKGISEEVGEIKIIAYSGMHINKIPAYRVSYEIQNQTISDNSNYITKNYGFINKNYIYTITTNSEKKDFSKIDSIMEQTINSLVFKN